MCYLQLTWGVTWSGEFQNFLELPSLIPHSPAGTWGLALCSEQRRSPNVGLMMGQRRRLWNNIKPISRGHLVFAGHFHVPFRCHPLLQVM